MVMVAGPTLALAGATIAMVHKLATMAKIMSTLNNLYFMYFLLSVLFTSLPGFTLPETLFRDLVIILVYRFL